MTLHSKERQAFYRGARRFRWSTLINFLHFSDFHIQERRGTLKEGVAPCLKLERVIEVAREMDVKPAFSIVTGDIAQD